MALIHCPECGREISDQASVCPGCGLPAGSAGGLVFFLLIFALLLSHMM